MHGAVDVLFETQLRTEGDGDLFFHQIDAVPAFRDAVFHLKSGIDFDEIGVAFRRHQKFHGGQGMVSDFAYQLTRIFLEAFTQLRRQPRPGGRRDFNELLVIALDGAVALVAGEHVAVLISYHLNLNVTHLVQVFFYKQSRVAERCLRHGGRFKKGVFQFRLIMDGEDASPAAAAFGFKHDGQADFFDKFAGGGHVYGSFRAGNHGDAQFFGDGSGLDLVAQHFHGVGCGADKRQASVGAFAGKAFVFGGEPPSGMDAHNSPLPGKGNDAINIKIGARVAAQQKQFLRGRGCRSCFVHIGGGHDGYRVKPFPDGTTNAPGGNASVGHEDGLAFQCLLNLSERFVRHGG